MIYKRFLPACFLLFLLTNFACSTETISPPGLIEERPTVTIKTPVDANGILNKIEANAVVVEGTSTLENGYLVTVLLSDGQNLVWGDAVVKGGKWITESMAISGFEDGEITVTAEGSNEKGIFSNKAETFFELDKLAPGLDITGPIAGDDLIEPEEAKAVVVKGTTDAQNGQTVLITFGDETANHLFAEAEVTGGYWETEIDLSSLKSGSLLLMAEVSDEAGNPATVQRPGVVLK